MAFNFHLDLNYSLEVVLDNFLKNIVQEDVTNNFKLHILGTISNYTNNVIGLGFLRQGHVLINEFWQKHIGDFTVDTERFAGLEDTINIMHRRGFRIVFTIQPFVSTESENFAETVKERLLISERSSDRRIPALTRYKSVSSAGVLDITNNRTIPWLMDKLQEVRWEVFELRRSNFYSSFSDTSTR